MDPLSLSFGAAGLLGLTIQTIHVVKPFLSSGKEIRESATALIAELDAVKSNLDRFDGILKHQSSIFGHTSSLRAILSAFEDKLLVLRVKFHQIQESRGARRLIWPLNRDEYIRAIQDIRAFASWIHFAVSLDQCNILTHTSEDVLRVLQQQVQTIQTMQIIRDQQDELKSAIADQQELLHHNRDLEERKNVLNWISPHDPYIKHHAIKSPRVEDTGGWLLQHPQYQDWRDGTSTHTLWCHGIQGSGKSVLASLIVDELTSYEEVKQPVAFIYFDYREQQTAQMVVSSIVQQIISTLDTIPTAIQEAYRNSSGVRLASNKLLDLFLTVLSSMGGVYLVIDALDECHERPQFLEFLAKIQSTGKVRALITSRPYPEDIRGLLNPCPQIDIVANESDLRRYMQQEFQGVCDAGVIDPHFASDLIERLIKESRGLFLLAVLHLRSILNEPTAGDMEDALNSASTTLAEAFAETMNRIKHLSSGQRKLAMKTLLWTCHAERLFFADELTEALSVRPGQKHRETKYRPSLRLILESCQGLIAVDPHTKEVRLAHHAIQEYLLEESDKIAQQAEIAEVCLTYLSFEEFQTGPCDGRASLQQRLGSHPLLEYAVLYNGVYANAAISEPRVVKLIQQLLHSQGAIASCLQVVRYIKGYGSMYWTPEECWSQKALHFAVYYGFNEAVTTILEHKSTDVNARTAMGTTPVIIAAARGQNDILRKLLANGADPSLQNWYGNALHCAAEAGRSECIRTLLQQGMDIDARRDCGMTPLHCTADRDCAEAADTLISCGANVNAVDDEGWTILHRAAYGRCWDLTILLLTKWKVDVNYPVQAVSERLTTALHFAVRAGDLDYVDQLLHVGAHPSCPRHCGVSFPSNSTFVDLIKHYKFDCSSSTSPECPESGSETDDSL